MADRNAAGTRVKTRDMWQVFLLLFVTSGIYRVWWMFVTSRDLGRFGRARQPYQRADIRTMPWMNAAFVALAYPGYGFLWFGLLPWGADAVPDAHISLTVRAVLTAIGLVLVAPALWAVLKTGRDVAVARRLGGLPHDRFDAQPWTWALVAFEAIGVPLWTFALQQRLNALWRCYPTLADEDLFGDLAPADRHAAAVAQRPKLTAARIARQPQRLEDPAVRPWVALGFLALCTFVFVWQVSSFGFGLSDADARHSGAVKLHIDGFWWRFWVANLIHGSVGHIVANTTVWVILAVKLERAVGHSRMLAMIVIGAVGSSIGELMYLPNEISLGASGIVFAAIGMAAAVDLRATTSLGWLSWTLVLIGVPISFAPGIGTGAHMGGLVAGFALGLVVRWLWKVERDGTAITEHDAERRPAIDYSAPLAPARAA